MAHLGHVSSWSGDAADASTDGAIGDWNSVLRKHFEIFIFIANL